MTRAPHTRPPVPGFVRRAAVLLLAAIALAAHVPAARAQTPVEVEIERVKPKKEKHETLRFLKENRDFIRARYDLLREKRLASRGGAEDIDPRFLAYREMLTGILAARDSVAGAEDARQRRELLESVTRLGDLEAQLDQMDRLLAGQRTRLGVLQEDFAGRQQTSLMVVLTGDPAAVGLTEVAITLEDGATLSIALSDEQRAALREGGAVQIFHGFVEPREQSVEVAIRGSAWPSGDAGWVTLEPARDRLTLLKLNLSTIDSVRGATSIQASTWLHDARTPSREG